jgi:RNA polymerase sigma factor (TIGR02999 family)
LPQEQFEPLNVSATDPWLPASDGKVAPDLFARLYEDLRRIARRELRGQGPLVTLSATTLLHELYLDLQDRQGVSFPDRARFLTYASRAMRGLVIDYARSRQTIKRGAAFEFTSLPADVPEEVADSAELQRVSEAVDRLAAMDPRLAQVVDLKYFSGFSLTDIAEMWGMSRRTVQRDWEKARLFLHKCLARSNEDTLS